MSREMKLFVAALLFLGVGGHAWAQDDLIHTCDDDRGVNRCDDKQQRQVRELFGVGSIEEHRGKGDQVRRVFFVDGYGRDVVALSFNRSPGHDPVLRVYFPHEKGGTKLDPIQAPVPLSVWKSVIAASSHFDRELVPLSVVPSDDVIVLCLHSWVYTVEATDPQAADGGHRSVRRRTENACANGLAEAYAWELARTAVSLLPPCDLLEADRYRNEASLLAACGLLRGDRLAAAAVLNRTDVLNRLEGADDLPLLRDLFDAQAKINWNGQVNGPGFFSAARFWSGKIDAGERTNFFIESIEGESSDRVRLTGSLGRWVEDAGKELSAYQTARLEQVWKRDGEVFVIESATVGPFVVVSD